MGFYNKAGKLIAGDPKKVKDVLEYVVFQRKMWEKNKGWTIYGYFNDINNNLLTQTNTQTKVSMLYCISFEIIPANSRNTLILIYYFLIDTKCLIILIHDYTKKKKIFTKRIVTMTKFII